MIPNRNLAIAAILLVHFFLLSDQEAWASHLSSETQACKAFYAKYGLNMMPSEIPAALADFVKNHKLKLLELAKKNPKALVLFKNRKLPEPGMSVEASLDWDELGRRVFVLRGNGVLSGHYVTKEFLNFGELKAFPLDFRFNATPESSWTQMPEDVLVLSSDGLEKSIRLSSLNGAYEMHWSGAQLLFPPGNLNSSYVYRHQLDVADSKMEWSWFEGPAATPWHPSAHADSIAPLRQDPAQQAFELLEARETALGPKAARVRENQNTFAFRHEQSEALGLPGSSQIGSPLNPQDQLRALPQLKKGDAIDSRSLSLFAREIRNTHALNSALASAKIKKISGLYEALTSRLAAEFPSGVAGDASRLAGQKVAIAEGKDAIEKVFKDAGQLEKELADSHQQMSQALALMKGEEAKLKDQVTESGSSASSVLAELHAVFEQEAQMSIPLQKALQREQSNLLNLKNQLDLGSAQLAAIAAQGRAKSLFSPAAPTHHLPAVIPAPEAAEKSLALFPATNANDSNTGWRRWLPRLFSGKSLAAPSAPPHSFQLVPEFRSLLATSLPGVQELAARHPEFGALLSKVLEPGVERELDKRAALIRDPLTGGESFLISPQGELRAFFEQGRLDKIWLLPPSGKATKLNELDPPGKNKPKNYTALWEIHYFSSYPHNPPDLKVVDIDQFSSDHPSIPAARHFRISSLHSGRTETPKPILQAHDPIAARSPEEELAALGTDPQASSFFHFASGQKSELTQAIGKVHENLIVIESELARTGRDQATALQGLIEKKMALYDAVLHLEKSIHGIRRTALALDKKFGSVQSQTVSRHLGDLGDTAQSTVESANEAMARLDRIQAGYLENIAKAL